MTNYEYYKTREDCERAFRKSLFLEDENAIPDFDKRFVDWIYKEHDAIKSASLNLVREFIARDTVTDEAITSGLLELKEALSKGNPVECGYAQDIGNLLKDVTNPKNIREAITYAMIIIGKEMIDSLHVANSGKDEPKEYHETERVAIEFKVLTPRKVCGNGYETKEKCPFFKDGYCTCAYCASLPPQYQRCDFHHDGPMYKKCSDVNRL